MACLEGSVAPWLPDSEDWYLDFRSGGSSKTPEQLRKFKAEFVLAQNTWRDKEARKEQSRKEDDTVCVVAPRPVPAGLKVPCALGTAETGKSLAAPLMFGPEEPLTWQRVERVSTIREALRDTSDAKWQESITGPDKTMPGMLTDHEADFRQRLLASQARSLSC